MRRLIVIASAMSLGLACLTLGPVVAASADDAFTVSPALGANVGGFNTRVTVTGASITAQSTVTIDKCKEPGAPPVSGIRASAGAVTFMVGPFAAGACNVNVVNGTTSVIAGTYTVGGDVWFVSPVGIVPSLVPIAGDASFMVTANLANTTNPSTSVNGDPKGLTGASGAVLSCAGTTVAGAVSVLNSQQVVVTPAALSGVAAGTPCGVTITLASGNTFDSSALVPAGVWADSGVPTVTVSPGSGPAGQDPAVLPKIQSVTIAGAGLDKATAVNFAFCPSTNPTALNAAVILSRTQGGGSLSVQVPNVPVSMSPPCAVQVVLPADGKRPANYSVASIPRASSSGYTGGFEFLSPYQGAITFTIANPYDGTAPRTGITDDNLRLCLVGTPSSTSVAPDFGTAVNVKTLTCTSFSGLAGYVKATHTATIAISAVLESGVLYFGDEHLVSGNAPDPRTSNARFGIFEFTYDAGGVHSDMTLIDQVGLTMSSEYFPQGSTVPFTGSHRDTGCLVDIVNGLSSAGVNVAATTQTPPGIMKYTGTPPAVSTLPAAGAWTAADLSAAKGWIGLVGASKLTSAYPTVKKYTSGVTSSLTITDHLGNDKNYSGDFAYQAVLANGVWTLSGTIKNGTAAGPQIQVEAAGLYGPGTHGGTGYGVYGQDGPFQVALPTGGTPTSPTYGSFNGWYSDGGAAAGVISTDWSNLLKTIYRDFVVGFAYGYWGSSAVTGGGTSTGPNATNFTQDPVTKAYHVAQPAYPDKAGQYAWNVYDDVIRSLSNVDGTTGPQGKPSGAYGMPYSDTYVPSALSPEGGQANIYSWNITLGDPQGCKASTPHLNPSKQTVNVKLGGTVLPVANVDLRSASGTADMLEYTAVNFGGPVGYALSTPDLKPARLPSGLAFSKTTGVISGTPTSTMAPTVFIVHGTSGAESATAQLSLAVGSRFITPARQIVEGRVSVPIDATVPFDSSSFTDPPVYSISPTLPAGLRLDAKTGVISGTPKATQSAKAYLVTATAPWGTAQANVAIEIEPDWLMTPEAQQVTALVGVPITPTVPFAVVGFTSAPTFTVSPSLPAGLTINATSGVISGTPSAAAPVTTYTVAGTGTNGGATSTVAITVQSRTRAVTPSSQSLTFQQGSYGASASLTASGFTGSVTFSLLPASLPQGVSFNSRTGVLSGIPSEPWPQQAYTVTASSGSASAKAAVALTVVTPSGPTPTPTPSPSPTPSPTPTGLGWCSPSNQAVYGTVGAALATAGLTIGAPAPVYVLANGSPALPAGLSGPGYSTGVISGVPTAPGTTTVQVHCQGQSGYQAFASITFVLASS